ncbi:MAG: hypothetical protein M1820_000988 [Bogoriella megaspora]|nr:MAG: hypothetical protein M1820_000988 [Bogoriella megaspora]
MRAHARISPWLKRHYHSSADIRQVQKPNLVQIKGATFYRHHPSSTNSASNRPLFPDLTFTIPSFASPLEQWAVVSPSASVRTAFLDILRSKHVCIPPTARTYPYLNTEEVRLKDPHLRNPARAIQYVGFDAERGGLGGSNMRGAYLSARYEARKEELDFSLMDYLKGDTELNPAEKAGDKIDQNLLARVIDDLKLEALIEMPVGNLSNGQTRRARIAKTLMTKPELLLLDGPFNPPTGKLLSTLLHQLAEARTPRILLSLRPQDIVPDWISHLVYANEGLEVTVLGPKNDVLIKVASAGIPTSVDAGSTSGVVDRPKERDASGSSALGEPVIEMQGVKVKYSERCVLGKWQQNVDGQVKEGLWWTVQKGQRWGIFGANGSGKTTLLSLITSDHPQTYLAPLRLFQRSRLPSKGKPGISIFDIQARIGHSSPEVHTFFPRGLSVRRSLESAWADAPLSKPNRLTDEGRRKINACLKWFQAELNPTLPSLDFSMPNNSNQSELELQAKYDRELARNSDEFLKWADDTRFGELSFSAQRVILFLRAVIRNPEIVILDEALSGMDERAKEKCSLFLSHGQSVAYNMNAQMRPSLQSALAVVEVPGLQPSQALLAVSHLKEEVPDCVREWITLPEPGAGPPRMGRLKGPMRSQEHGWSDVWGMRM